MKKVPPKNGFTLVELVLVTVILTVVGMAVYGAFANGINIWKRVTRRPVTEDVYVFFKNISYDLRNSFKITGIKFRGGGSRVSFPTRIKYRDNEGVEDSVGEVVYSFDRRKKTLYKQRANYSEIFVKKQGRKTALIEGVSSLHLRYFIYDPEDKKYSWVTSWQESDELFGAETEERLPLIVRIEIGIPMGRAEQKFVKTVPIPSACCWPFADDT